MDPASRVARPTPVGSEGPPPSRRALPGASSLDPAPPTSDMTNGHQQTHPLPSVAALPPARSGDVLAPCA